MNGTDRQRFGRFNPLLEVDAPWQAAREIIARGGRVSPRRDGPEVAEAVRYLRALDRAGDEHNHVRVRRRWPAIFGAHAIALENGPRRWEIEARLLAAEDDQEIAGACGVAPGVVHRFESLFFRVRERLDDRDWISPQAIRRWSDPTRPAVLDLGTIWRGAGYYSGSLVLGLLIAVELGRPLTPWVVERLGFAAGDAEELLRRRVRLHVELLTSPPTSRSSAFLRLVEEARERSRREMPDDSRARLVASAVAGTDLLRAVHEVVVLLARAALIAAGYHRHDRGTWRKRRGSMR